MGLCTAHHALWADRCNSFFFTIMKGKRPARPASALNPKGPSVLKRSHPPSRISFFVMSSSYNHAWKRPAGAESALNPIPSPSPSLQLQRTGAWKGVGLFLEWLLRGSEERDLPKSDSRVTLRPITKYNVQLWSKG